MVVTTVMVQVKPEFIESFIFECTKNHKNSINEPGNKRFDILQSKEDPTKFLLYEAYESLEHVAVHKQTEHYESWKNAVAPWMAEQRKGIQYKAICP